jgi:signal peptidase I
MINDTARLTAAHEPLLPTVGVDPELSAWGVDASADILCWDASGVDPTPRPQPGRCPLAAVRPWKAEFLSRTLRAEFDECPLGSDDLWGSVDWQTRWPTNPGGQMRRMTWPMLMSMIVLLAACDGAGTNRYRVPNGSMEPGIKAGATVTAEEAGEGTYRGRRGDVVVFQRPDSWPTEVGDTLVKRVIAVAGETVACCDESGRVTVDGAVLDEPYLGSNAPLTAASNGCRGRRFGPATVPDDHVFLLGDSRLISVDSACHGPVPTADVIGVVRP